ncbi:MAG TPA: hypothetical protein VKF40_20525, partial [Burkholderiales bacterium]|nr:hypothetical protein [Burkholderiales bacterium]
MLEIINTAPEPFVLNELERYRATSSRILHVKSQPIGSSAMHEPLSHEQLADRSIVGVVPFAAPQHVLHRDYETRSRTVLKKIGAHKYAADPSTEVMFCAHAVDDGPVQLWRRGDPVPPVFFEAATDLNWSVGAHGDHFETAIEQDN